MPRFSEAGLIIQRWYHFRSGSGQRYLPFACTEQGVALLSGILQSDKAIQVNIAIMRHSSNTFSLFCHNSV